MSIDTRRDWRPVEVWKNDLTKSITEESRLVGILLDIHAGFLAARKIDFGLEMYRSDPPVTYTPEQYDDTVGDFLMKVTLKSGEVLERLIQVEKKENVSDSRFRFKKTRVELCLAEKQPVWYCHHGYKCRAFTFAELEKVSKTPTENSKFHGGKKVHILDTGNYKDWLFFSDLKELKYAKEYVRMLKILINVKELI